MYYKQWLLYSSNFIFIVLFLLFLQGFHNWTLNPFHMMGVAGILGGALLSGYSFIHRSTRITHKYYTQVLLLVILCSVLLLLVSYSCWIYCCLLRGGSSYGTDHYITTASKFVRLHDTVIGFNQCCSRIIKERW